MKRLPLSLLLVLNVVLLAVVGGVWLLGQARWDAPAAQAPDPASLVTQRITREVAAADMLPQTLQRPLFVDTRRPSPPAEETVAEAVAEPDPLHDVLLLGMFTVGGEKHLMLRAEGKVSRLKQGDSFGPWKVGALSDSVAVFQRGKERRELQLKRAAQPAGRTAPLIRRLPMGAPLAPAPVPADDAARGDTVEPVSQQDQLQEAPPAAAPRSARTLARRAATQRGQGRDHE